MNVCAMQLNICNNILLLLSESQMYKVVHGLNIFDDPSGDYKPRNLGSTIDLEKLVSTHS